MEKTKKEILRDIEDIENTIGKRYVIKPAIMGHDLNGSKWWAEYKQQTAEFIRQRDELIKKANSI